MNKKMPISLMVAMAAMIGLSGCGKSVQDGPAIINSPDTGPVNPGTPTSPPSNTSNPPGPIGGPNCKSGKNYRLEIYQPSQKGAALFSSISIESKSNVAIDSVLVDGQSVPFIYDLKLNIVELAQGNFGTYGSEIEILGCYPTPVASPSPKPTGPPTVCPTPPSGPGQTPGQNPGQTPGQNPSPKPTPPIPAPAH